MLKFSGIAVVTLLAAGIVPEKAALAADAAAGNQLYPRIVRSVTARGCSIPARARTICAR